MTEYVQKMSTDVQLFCAVWTCADLRAGAAYGLFFLLNVQMSTDLLH